MLYYQHHAPSLKPTTHDINLPHIPITTPSGVILPITACSPLFSFNFALGLILPNKLALSSQTVRGSGIDHREQMGVVTARALLEPRRGGGGFGGLARGGFRHGSSSSSLSTGGATGAAAGAAAADDGKADVGTWIWRVLLGIKFGVLGLLV